MPDAASKAKPDPQPEPDPGAAMKALEEMEGRVTSALAKLEERERALAAREQEQSGEREARLAEREAALDAQQRALTEAAVNSHPGDPAVDERLDEPVLFRSKGRNFSCTMVASNRWFAPNGQAQITEGRRLDFAPTGEYESDEVRVVEFLRSRDSFNREFWEVGNEPGAVPSPELLLDKIVAASVALDLEALEEIEAVEQGGHARELVMKAVRSARNQVERALGDAAKVPVA